MVLPFYMFFSLLHCFGFEDQKLNKLWVLDLYQNQQHSYNDLFFFFFNIHHWQIIEHNAFIWFFTYTQYYLVFILQNWHSIWLSHSQHTHEILILNWICLFSKIIYCLVEAELFFFLSFIPYSYYSCIHS